MAIDSIRNSTAVSTSGAPRGASSPVFRNNPVILNDIASQQKAGRALQVFATPQTSKSGGASSVKLPRGSLVDVLA